MRGMPSIAALFITTVLWVTATAATPSPSSPAPTPAGNLTSSPAPAPTTSVPLPSVSGMTEEDAMSYCTGLGWTSYLSGSTDAIICAAPGTTKTQDCNTCSTWRLVVYIDGGRDNANKGDVYLTKAGSYYGGHDPCAMGWNLPYCGNWSAATPIPSAEQTSVPGNYTPNPDDIPIPSHLTLTSSDAIQYCQSMGWSWSNSRSINAIICTAPGTSSTKDCNTCTTWRLVVYADGGHDTADNDELYQTYAGSYYGGHNPCKVGWNLPYCGKWYEGGSPAPTTAVPLPTARGLTQDDAMAYCGGLGWNSYVSRSTNAIICTTSGFSPNYDCNNCSTWRLVVYIDGGHDTSNGGEEYDTKAGSYYGGHNPCKVGWNLPYCGQWVGETPIPSSEQTPVPAQDTPNPSEVPLPSNLTLTADDAKSYCTAMGWSFATSRSVNAIVCTAPGTSSTKDCNTCTTWRLVVYVDGGHDTANNNEPYQTFAGLYYGGHNPCKVGWNLPYCGKWYNGETSVPLPTYNGLTQGGAMAYCGGLGWKATTTSSTNAIICTAPGVSISSDCNTCSTWRLVVYMDGGSDNANGGETYHTKAGRYYGGHNPCKVGWNLPYCGDWGDVSPIPSPEQTPVPEKYTPNPDDVPIPSNVTLTSSDAKAYCNAMGWTVTTTRSEDAIVCTASGTSSQQDCNTCTSWRLVVYVDGGHDTANNNEPYKTYAGSYYGGHKPCKVGWNVPYCGKWHDGVTSVPLPTPAPVTTPVPLPTVSGTTQDDAIRYCSGLGWTPDTTQSTNSIICTAAGVSYVNNCNTCSTWRLLVYVDGGRDNSHGGDTYATKAGSYYGGHNPCRGGWNLPYCGQWSDATPIPPAERTPVPGKYTPNPEDVPMPPNVQLTEADARLYCSAMGWTTHTTRSENATLCVRNGTSTGSDCNTCTTWRLVVYADGGHDTANNNEPYKTYAGSYYGGHNPCKVGWNLPYCGKWYTGPLPDTPVPPTPEPPQDYDFIVTAKGSVVDETKFKQDVLAFLNNPSGVIVNITKTVIDDDGNAVLEFRLEGPSGVVYSDKLAQENARNPAAVDDALDVIGLRASPVNGAPPEPSSDGLPIAVVAAAVAAAVVVVIVAAAVVVRLKGRKVDDDRNETYLEMPMHVPSDPSAPPHALPTPQQGCSDFDAYADV